jgi:hypothetical protein
MRKSLVTVSLVSLIAGLGCVADDGPAFFISGNVAPDPGSCTLSVGNDLYIRGVLDVSVGNGYLLQPLFNNQLVPRAADAPPRANPNGVVIQGAEVEIQDAAGSAVDFGGLPNPFTVAATTYVPTSTGATSPGQEVGAFEVIPPAYVAALDGMVGTDPGSRILILVSFGAFGETTGGVDIEVSEFVWPIDVCRNCLYLPAGPDDEVGCCTPGQDVICYYEP